VSTLAASFDRVLDAAPGQWSLCIIDGAGAPVYRRDAERVRPTASSAKVLVLLAAAIGIEAGDLDPRETLRRDAVGPVADSGLWQWMDVAALPLVDVAMLVGSVSDNLATNVLLARLGGPGAVMRLARSVGVHGVALHDIVRDVRTDADPSVLSSGTAEGYAAVFHQLGRGEMGGDRVSARVCGWLANGCDLSMVAGAFGFDPLAHAEADRGWRLCHKTGTDVGVRADSGVIAYGARRWAYSCLAHFDEAAGERDDVLAAMRTVGRSLRDALPQMR
jgi:beta-lactamase class A